MKHPHKHRRKSTVEATIREGKNGGYTVDYPYEHEKDNRPYIFGDIEGVLEHLIHTFKQEER